MFCAPDGGYSDWLDCHTVTVSPFSGSADICPARDSLEAPVWVSVSNTRLEVRLVNIISEMISLQVSRDNLHRILSILLPPSPELLARSYQSSCTY